MKRLAMTAEDARHALGPVRLLQAATWAAAGARVVPPEKAQRELEQLAVLEKKLAAAGGRRGR